MEKRFMVVLCGMAIGSMLLTMLTLEPCFIIGALPFLAYLRGRTLYPMIERTCWPRSCQKKRMLP